MTSRLPVPKLTIQIRFAVDQGITIGHCDAVQQRILPQVVVDQRHNDTQFGEAQPTGHILGPVLHQQADSVALFVPMCMEHVRQPIRELVDLSERPHAVLQDKARLFRGLGDKLLEHVSDGHVAPLKGFDHVQDLYVPP